MHSNLAVWPRLRQSAPRLGNRLLPRKTGARLAQSSTDTSMPGSVERGRYGPGGMLPGAGGKPEEAGRAFTGRNENRHFALPHQTHDVLCQCHFQIGAGVLPEMSARQNRSSTRAYCSAVMPIRAAGSDGCTFLMAALLQAVVVERQRRLGAERTVLVDRRAFCRCGQAWRRQAARDCARYLHC